MVAKTKTVLARIEPGLKRDAEAVFRRVGLTSSEAIGLFLKKVTLEGGLPFEVRVPNKETRKAIADVRAGRGVKTFKTFDDFARYIRSI